MDPLKDCVEALRALAKEPLSDNQVLMAEYRITEFRHGAQVSMWAAPDYFGR
jgi:hypothetical protein